MVSVLKPLSAPNALRWDGAPGHYEVYYVTLTDRASGVGAWIRYTMLAPLAHSGAPAGASLWFLTMDPHGGPFARKTTVGIDAMSAHGAPFELRIGDAVLSDTTMRGSFEDVAWDLRWAPSRSYEHVHPLLRRAASTMLVLPHADLAIEGKLRFAGRELELDGARGGQAHLWGSKHANRWAWAHCNDFAELGGDEVSDTFVDAVSVVVSRFGREVGPNTPVVARLDGEDFRSTTPLRVLANDSTFALTGWRFDAVGAGGARKLRCEVDAEREQLAGVTYVDPDGERAYCYNSEVASMRMHVYDRSRRVGGWSHRTTLVSRGRAHFEYAQRDPVPDIELLTS